MSIGLAQKAYLVTSCVKLGRILKSSSASVFPSLTWIHVMINAAIIPANYQVQVPKYWCLMFPQIKICDCYLLWLE